MQDATINYSSSTEHLQQALLDYRQANGAEQKKAAWQRIVALTSSLNCRHVTRFANTLRGSFDYVADEIELQSHPWLYLNHYSGYVRQQALANIAQQSQPLPNSLFGALLLLRLNDWVKTVRAQALATFQAKLTQPGNHDYTQAIVWLLDMWLRWGRQAAAEREPVLRLLVQSKMLPALLNYLQREPTRPIARALQQLAHLSAIDDSLWRLATTARQPLIRLFCYKSLFKQQLQWIVDHQWQVVDKFSGKRRWAPVWEGRALTRQIDRMEILNHMARDKAALVRRQAGALLIEIADTDPRVQQMAGLAQLLATDRFPAVAYRGDFALRELKKNPAADEHC